MYISVYNITHCECISNLSDSHGEQNSTLGSFISGGGAEDHIFLRTNKMWQIIRFEG